MSLVDLAHPLVKLGEKMNWQVFDEQLGQTFDGKTGGPEEGDTGDGDEVVFEFAQAQVERLAGWRPRP